jgi:hypothetical protein
MLLNISVIVQAAPSSANTTYDAEGIPTIAWTASQTTEMSNKQPLSGEIAFKEYGISDAGITNLFFLKTSTTAQEGGRIVHGTDTYDIFRVEQYPNHYEVIVKPLVT